MQKIPTLLKFYYFAQRIGCMNTNNLTKYCNILSNNAPMTSSDRVCLLAGKFCAGMRTRSGPALTVVRYLSVNGTFLHMHRTVKCMVSWLSTNLRRLVTAKATIRCRPEMGYLVYISVSRVLENENDFTFSVLLLVIGEDPGGRWAGYNKCFAPAIQGDRGTIGMFLLLAWRGRQILLFLAAWT